MAKGVEMFTHKEPDHSMKPRNRFKVPAKQWNRWADLARAVFNSVFIQMKDDQRLYLHPKTIPVPNLHWKTTAWNAAWIAANNAQETLEEWGNA